MKGTILTQTKQRRRIMQIIKQVQYPHYVNLPFGLSHNLSLLRTNLYEGVEGSCEISCTIDHNDLEFLDLDGLVVWISATLPEYDADFLKAATRVHKECYEEGLFSYFGVDTEDLYVELLHVKDAYELMCA